MTITLVASKETGRRTVLGTDWPIENVVSKRTKWGKVYWNVAFGLCNGTPSSSENFKTRREALEAAGI